MSPFSLAAFLRGKPDPASLNPQQVRERLAAEPKTQLVDVRSAEERREAYLKGSKLIPLPDLPGRLGELDPGKPVILYCRSGMRSATALRLLRESGFREAVHLSGGLMAWVRAGLPLEKGR